MPKLVYVYEGILAERDRHELVGVRCFGGGYEGTERTQQLWKEVYDYISRTYDERVLERIYVNGDGADWIKTGEKVHGKAKFVLDRYHIINTSWRRHPNWGTARRMSGVRYGVR